MFEPEAQDAACEDGDGVESKNKERKVGKEGERIKKEGGGKMAVEKLPGGASRAAGEAGQAGQGMKGAPRYRKPGREPDRGDAHRRLRANTARQRQFHGRRSPRLVRGSRSTIATSTRLCCGTAILALAATRCKFISSMLPMAGRTRPTATTS